MATRYKEVSIEEFEAVMSQIGFTKISPPNTFEYVFERAMNEARFAVRIYSSISLSTHVSRGIGEDAIRVTIFDYTLNTVVYNVVVKRTTNALKTLVLRAREAWAWKNQNKCSCGAIMKERKGRNGVFLGCSAYPACKNTREI